MPSAQAPVRLSTEDRRRSILEAIRSVFAEKGFHGTTTKQLSEAAGVSEALLFKHFPSKEAMYAAMQEACWSEVAQDEMQRLALLTPCTSSLVMLVYKLMSKIIGGPPFSPNQLEKLMIRSMLEDGQFARGFLKRFDQGWLAKFEECIVEAEKAGDVLPNAVPGRIRGWFVHDLAVFVMIQLLQTPAVADYGATRQELIDYGVRFVLTGIGMTGQAIAQHYNPQAFALLDSH